MQIIVNGEGSQFQVGMLRALSLVLECSKFLILSDFIKFVANPLLRNVKNIIYMISGIELFPTCEKDEPNHSRTGYIAERLSQF